MWSIRKLLLNCLIVIQLSTLGHVSLYSIAFYYIVVVLHCIALARLQFCCLCDAAVRCLPFHIIFIKHSLTTQAASQWGLCFSGSLPNVLTCLWLIIFLSHSREINMMMFTSLHFVVNKSQTIIIIIYSHFCAYRQLKGKPSSTCCRSESSHPWWRQRNRCDAGEQCGRWPWRQCPLMRDHLMETQVNSPLAFHRLLPPSPPALLNAWIFIIRINISIHLIRSNVILFLTRMKR